MQIVEIIETVVESVTLAVAVYVVVTSAWAMTEEPWCDKKGDCGPKSRAGGEHGR